MKTKAVLKKIEITVEDRFCLLKDLPYVKEPIEFIKSLNLTDEQYSKLWEIINEYGLKKYEECSDDESMRIYYNEE